MFTPRVERHASRLARSCLPRSCVGSNVLCRSDRGSSVSPRCWGARLFPCARLRVVFLCRFPRSTREASSNRSLSLGAPSLLFAAHAFQRSRSYQGLGPPHDITRSRPPAALRRSRRPSLASASAPALGIRCCGELPRSPLRSVLGRSQPLDGFLRDRARGLVSSRSHVQDHHRSGGFSLDAAALSRRQRLAPLPLLRARSPVARLPPARTSTSRPCSTSSRVASAWR
jgi:hypothetical protein